MNKNTRNADPVQAFLTSLKCVRQAGPDQWMARCPAHDDEHASLSIARGRDGRALIDCKANCKTADVLKAVGMTMADLFPTSSPAGDRKPSPAARATAAKPEKKPKRVYKTPAEAFDDVARQVKGRFVDAWAYPGDGFRVARFALPEDGKTYRPIYRRGKGWAVGDPDGLLPLYRGDKLAGADDPVVVLEGEKCADAAGSIDLTAVTSAHGAGSAHKSDWRRLAGREVIIVLDHDDAGRKYAAEVAAILWALSPPAEVRIIDLPGLAEHEDFADWINADGPMGDKSAEEIVGAVLALAETVEPWKPKAILTAAMPVVTCLADVQPRPVEWLWPSRVPLGKLTLLAGDPGLGKSSITLDMAARVSRGMPWPDCPAEANEIGGVVLLGAEDDVADTVRPRLDAAGADVTRIVALQAVRRTDAETGEEREYPFDLRRDLPALEQAVANMGDCRLVIIDPISAYLGGADSHRNAEIRGLLAPLADLAARHGVAVVAVTHLRKGDGPALYRAMGSLAFIAAARAGYVVAKDTDDATGRRRLMLPLKSNLSSDQSGLAYRLDDSMSFNGQPVVAWEADPVEIDTDEALRFDRGRSAKASPELDEAQDWLAAELAEGPRPVKDILAHARRDGIAKRTLDRAKGEMGVLAEKSGFRGGWVWRLPNTEGDAGESGGDEGEDGAGGKDDDEEEDDDEDDEERQGPKGRYVATFAAGGNLGEFPKESGRSPPPNGPPRPKSAT